MSTITDLSVLRVQLAGDETMPIELKPQTRVDVPAVVNGDTSARDRWTDMWQSVWIQIPGRAEGFTKLRIGVQSDSGHTTFAIFGEVQDRSGIVVPVFYDPSPHPVPYFRAHVFNVHLNTENRGVGSVVFQNEHSAEPRHIRVNLLSRRS